VVTNEQRTPRLMVIGLDGASFDVMGEWLDAGLLPNLGSIFGEGAHGVLRSTIPPVTPAAWTTFMTGKNPGKHGIFTFEGRKPGHYEQRLTCGGMRRSCTIWDIMNEHGLSVGVVNVPYTYPPDPVKGYMISGMDAPAFDRRVFHPASLYEEVLSQIGRYTLARLPRRGERYDVAELRQQIDKMGGAAKFLLERHPVDVFAVVFTPTDHVSHHFLSSKTASQGAEGIEDLVEWTYRRVDAHVGELLRFAGPETTVIVMSDHGMGTIERGVNLNRGFADGGLLKFHGGSGERESVRGDSCAVARGLLTMLSRTVRRRISSQMLRRLAQSRLPIHKVHWWMSSGGIKWEDTVCYTMATQGLVRLNVRGRDPNGIVEPGPCFEATRRSVADFLLGLRDPKTGRPLIEKVHFREDIYHGPWVDDGPDLIATESDDAPWGILPGLMGAKAPLLVSRPEAERRVVDLPEGWHRPNGIFMARGPGIARRVTGSWHIADIAPTALHLLGLPVPDDMDGAIMEGVLSEEARQRKIARDPGERKSKREAASFYSEDEEQSVRDQLSGLGYLD